MKENCLTFDAFVEWLEHYGIKMWWMIKCRGEWRPKLGWLAKMGGRSAITSSLSLLSSPLPSSLPQPPSRWDKVDGQWPHGLVARPPLGSPIKWMPRGASSFIPQAHKQPQIF
jgi:hypothetical protein